MRRLPAAIVVSVTGHMVALAWIVRGGDVLAIPLRGLPAVAARAAEPPPGEEISLTLLDAHRAAAEVPPASVSAPPPPTAPPPGPPAHASRNATGTLTTGRPSTEPAIATGAATPGERSRAAPGRSPWMTMRPPAGPPPTTGLSPEFMRRFLESSRPLAPQPGLPDEDSAVDLGGAPDARGNIVAADQGPTRRHIARVELRGRQELKPAAGGGYQADRPTFTARIDADGAAHLEDKPLALDAQDHLMKRNGSDPYARAKLAFFDRTRDQRAAIAERHARAQLARSAARMQQNIDRLWAATRDLAARKQGLFELWDDCAETGSDELVTAGARARALVIGVIRARLRGGDAYSAAELARLDAIRRSTAVFAPHDGSPPPAP